MAETAVVVDVNRSHPAAHLHIAVIDHDHRQRTAGRQTRFPVQRQLLQLALECGVEGCHHFGVTAFAEHHAREQRRQLWHLPGSQPYRLFLRLCYLLRGPDALRGHTFENFVTCCLGTLRPAVRAQAARGLRQNRKQRGFGVAQLCRRFSQIGPTGGPHAL